MSLEFRIKSFRYAIDNYEFRVFRYAIDNYEFRVQSLELRVATTNYELKICEAYVLSLRFDNTDQESLDFFPIIKY